MPDKDKPLPALLLTPVSSEDGAEHCKVYDDEGNIIVITRLENGNLEITTEQ